MSPCPDRMIALRRRLGPVHFARHLQTVPRTELMTAMRGLTTSLNVRPEIEGPRQATGYAILAEIDRRLGAGEVL